MQEISGSLSEVIRAYSDHNLLVPAATDVQLNPFYKYHVEEVAVDLSENSGDIYKVNRIPTGKKDGKGKEIWQDTYSLSKPLLNKLAMAAGIQFNPQQTYGRSSRMAKVQQLKTELCMNGPKIITTSMKNRKPPKRKKAKSLRQQSHRNQERCPENKE